MILIASKLTFHSNGMIRARNVQLTLIWIQKSAVEPVSAPLGGKVIKD